MRLRHIDGGPVVIRQVTPRDAVDEPSYNLSVDETSTYFVGAGVLVHNAPVNIGLGNKYLIYRATNAKYPKKVYIGQATEFDVKGEPRGEEAREGEHREKAARKLKLDAANIEELEPGDRDFYEFMREAELEVVVEGIATQEQADYIEQQNIDIERKIPDQKVINRRNQITSEAHKKAVVEKIMADHDVRARGYCP